MNLTFDKNLVISIVVGVVILAVAAYLLFFKSSGTVAVVVEGGQNADAATFVDLAQQLEPLGFDTSILSDPRFVSLVDLHTVVLPEAVGRPDPFADFK